MYRCAANSVFTTPLGGEVGERCEPGEGDWVAERVEPPHPKPLPQGEREPHRMRGWIVRSDSVFTRA